jgi:putative FmdB family regulatory protein
MPIREYQCRECGHIMENFELKAEDALTQCVQCESGQIERLLSAHGGYSMDSGPSSIRPRRAGSFKRHK